MHVLKSIGLFALLLGLLAGCGKKSNPSHAVVSKFEGKWTVVELHERGRAVGAELIKQMNVTIEQGRFQKALVNTTELTRAEEAAIQVDPTKSPAQIDFVCLIGDDQGKARPGIFALEGDTLKICLGELGGARPTDFVVSDDTELMLLARKKP